MIDTKNPKVLNEMGDRYFEGKNTEQNIELAYTYYKQAADTGNPIGLYNVGRYFLAKEQYKNAIDYLTKALSSGYAQAYLLLAEMAIRGKGMRKNKKKAFKYTQEGAKFGNTDAYNQLARYYLEGIGCAKNERKAWEYYQKSADLDNVVGMYQLARLHLSSQQGRKSAQNALHWLDKAIEVKHVPAIRLAIELYQTPHLEFKKRSQAFREEMIFYYLEKLAQSGDVPALEKVALDYYEGTSVTKMNHEKARIYFQMLSDKNQTIGLYGLGASFLYGHGGEKDSKKAKALLEQAAERGYEKAMAKLGEMYRLGLGVTADPEQAMKWYYDAAKKDHPEALLNLGLLHYRNEIPHASGELAFKYVENAKKKGSIQADYWLGIFYEKGVGVPVNALLSEKHLLQAIQNNVVAAHYKYAMLQYDQAQQVKGKKKQKRMLEAFVHFRMYLKSPTGAKSNQSMAAYQIALMFHQDFAKDPNLRTARYWYEYAAEMGHTKAMIEVYRMLKKNEPAQALKYLNHAMELNDPEAWYELGVYFLEGSPIQSADPARAKEYFLHAARLKYKPAVDRLAML